jgi:hypothetical protein
VNGDVGERSLGRLVGELGKVMHGVSVSLPCHVFMTMFGASHTDLFSGYRLDPHRRSQPCPLLDHHPHIHTYPMHHFPELTNEPTETPLWVKLIPAVQVAIPVSAPSGPEYAFAWHTSSWREKSQWDESP